MLEFNTFVYMYEKGSTYYTQTLFQIKLFLLCITNVLLNLINF